MTLKTFQQPAMKLWKHVRAVALLPVVVAVAIPAVILSCRRPRAERDAKRARKTRVLIGSSLLAGGLVLVGATIRLFARAGQGTLAPWDPTKRLVIEGPYRYVRNPMISGVLCVLLGEAALFGSAPLLLWASVFFAVNATYIPLSEEPGLEKRFGTAYQAYRRNVPRWRPRWTPWTQK